MSHLKFHHRSLYFMNSPEFLVYLVNDGYLFAKGLGDISDSGSIPDWDDSLEEGMATHSSILTGESPWTEEPAGLQSIES